MAGMKETPEMMPHSAVVEDALGVREYDLRALHLSQGRIIVEGAINTEMAIRFASAMMHLADEQKPATIVLNSPGGSVADGLMMYDIIRSYPYELTIWCVGMAASMGAVLLAAGHKGRRYILPHSTVMVHEPRLAGSLGGSATSIEKTAQSILETRTMINTILARHTGKSLEEINAVTATDYFMDARQAVTFGICDEVRDFFTE